MIGERYLEVVLRLAKLAPELVDSYAGPAELAARVASERPRTPAELEAEIRELLEAVATEEDQARRAWLRAQLEALEVATRWVGGERLPYPEYVERCYSVRPRLEPEEAFAEAHRRLDVALPGSGGVAARTQAWLETQIVPPHLISAGLEALGDELRERTRERFGLPADEEVKFVVVSGERWSAFAEYTGDLKSEIFVNMDLPIPSFVLLELVAHEVYPGHHTEHVAKEVALVPHGYLEVQVFLYPTPQALVAEGIAELALEALLGDDAEEAGAAALRPLGIPYDAETAAAVRRAKKALKPLQQNVLLLDLPTEDAWAYKRRWMLEPDEFVDKSIEAIRKQSWRPYFSCYPEGYRLCRAFVDGDPGRFGRLLNEQLTPADLRSGPPPRTP
ncbi:MAG TPA: hypothetical protein VF101_16315 [Gaiellaceae bacterium]